ncbi:MAG TPA: peptidoglycan-associated lipoprotein Pal [Geobacteraceae bacterium]
MRRGVVGCGVVLCCGLLFAGGCAKEEIVKKEEPIAAPAPAPQPPPTKPTPPAPVEKPAPQPAPVVKEEPVESTGAKAAVTDVTEEASALQKALEKIYFDFDSAALSDTARGSLKKDFDLLKKNSNVKVEIEGHCDERGSDEYNLALGERRAKATMSYLVTLGLSPERLSTISYGKEKPADPGHDEAAWSKNRRAEFVVVK